MGDASLPKPASGEHHYYTETKKLTHKSYLLWKRHKLPAEFEGNFYEDDTVRKNPRCTWETGVSQIFTTIRPHLYPQNERGYKSIISGWVIYQIDQLGDLALFGLLIWLLDDGRNNMSRGYPNLEICIERWEFNIADVERVCTFFNLKFRLHLYVRPGASAGASNTLIIPAEDRDRLIPIWRGYAGEYGIPACMDYKFPAFNPPINGRSRRLFWEQKHPERRRELAQITYQMRLAGKSFVEIGHFLEQEGHPLKTTARYLPEVWKRLFQLSNQRVMACPLSKG